MWKFCCCNTEKILYKVSFMLRATRNSVWQLLKQSVKTGSLLDQQKDHGGHSWCHVAEVSEINITE
jgi:hypothetical protein